MEKAFTMIGRRVFFVQTISWAGDQGVANGEAARQKFSAAVSGLQAVETRFQSEKVCSLLSGVDFCLFQRSIVRPSRVMSLVVFFRRTVPLLHVFKKEEASFRPRIGCFYPGLCISSCWATSGSKGSHEMICTLPASLCIQGSSISLEHSFLESAEQGLTAIFFEMSGAE